MSEDIGFFIIRPEGFEPPTQTVGSTKGAAFRTPAQPAARRARPQAE
jgi:hypothetical protein